MTWIKTMDNSKGMCFVNQELRQKVLLEIKQDGVLTKSKYGAKVFRNKDFNNPKKEAQYHAKELMQRMDGETRE